MKKIVVLTGAGISAESGIKTFRDAGGLWEGHDIHEVASPDGWAKNPLLVLDFYNQRRRQLFEVEPNAAHRALVELESRYELHIVTQNVDDLHERGGATNVLHLHGELRKVRSSVHGKLVYDWDKDVNWGDTCERGAQLRPHIVWFGESVPMMDRAIELAAESDIFLVVGTSMQVYPAAGLIDFVPAHAQKYYIDLHPAKIHGQGNLKIVAAPASVGVRQVVDELLAV